MKHRQRNILPALATAILLSLAFTVRGATNEYKVKAAFIYNFAQFIEWPAKSFGADPKSPLVIAVVGTDPFDGALDQAMAGRAINGRPIVVRHFAAGADVTACHLLYCGPAAQDEFKAAVDHAGGACVTVGESREMLAAGGVIRFYTEDNKLRFEINTKAAARQDLKISAKLLKLARIYEE